MEDSPKDTLEGQYLDAFARWLGSLGSDASALAGSIQDEALPADARGPVVGALTYLVKSLDLIPDGVEDLGYIDDAFVLRVASALALGTVPETERDSSSAVAGLAKDAALIELFLGAAYSRLERYAARLIELSARGRSAQDALADPEQRTRLVSEVQAWAKSYETPKFQHDPRSLIKLLAFLDTKLPA